VVPRIEEILAKAEHQPPRRPVLQRSKGDAQ
jgi:hypothetical protein